MTYRARCIGHKARTKAKVRINGKRYGAATVAIYIDGARLDGGCGIRSISYGPAPMSMRGFTVADPQKAFVDIMPSGPATATIQAQGKP